MSEYFPNPKSLWANVKIELDLLNYPTKADAIQQDLTQHILPKKTDWANSKSDVDKLYIDKLKNVRSNLSNLKNDVDKLNVDKLVPVPVDLSKLSDVVKNNFVKKDVYNAKIKNIQDKILDISNLNTNASRNVKVTVVKGERSIITSLATNASLNAKILKVKYLILLT